MKEYVAAVVFLFVLGTALAAQEIPKELQGKWIVRRILPTSTISCWTYKQGRQLVGTEIEYTPESLRWKDRVASHPLISIRKLSAKEFHDEYSGSGVHGSQVTFAELGIQAPSATLVQLTHDDIKPIDGVHDVPGDTVLIKNKDTIIFSVCNVYFEAQRLPRKHKPPSPHQESR